MYLQISSMIVFSDLIHSSDLFLQYLCTKYYCYFITYSKAFSPFSKQKIMLKQHKNAILTAAVLKHRNLQMIYHFYRRNLAFSANSDFSNLRYCIYFHFNHLNH